LSQKNFKDLNSRSEFLHNAESRIHQELSGVLVQFKPFSTEAYGKALPPGTGRARFLWQFIQLTLKKF